MTCWFLIHVYVSGGSNRPWTSTRVIILILLPSSGHCYIAPKSILGRGLKQRDEYPRICDQHLTMRTRFIDNQLCFGLIGQCRLARVLIIS
ncbi:hypothetical protein BJX99DRAFT_28780 [Aspergillus californicus]